MICRSCGNTVIILTVLAPLLTMVVLGGNHNKSKRFCIQLRFIISLSLFLLNNSSGSEWT